MDYEKLGLFYLGRRVEAASGAADSLPLLYDASDLVTHAVIVGMTGSGKTGLGIGLIEEAAIDGIPVIAIDPKGDLPNLLLTFPNLSAADFEPWVNEDDARAAGMERAAFAASEAERWKAGLAEWNQDGQRIARLKNAAEIAVYTPGSRTGLPLSIVRSFAAPAQALVDDAELFAERVSTAATSVLTMAGIDAVPIESREHVLVSALLAEAWRAGRDLDLAGLIGQVQTPPLTRIGALDLEAFYPSADRFALAVKLNHLLAAPGFDAWLEGDPLDVDRLLHTADARPRISVISIAHLNDAERMFFVSLLLNEVLAWMRVQRGTSSLRALLYFDEIVGFLPPVANPPSKPPLLTLLKQARAFGLGCALATQNPVDLDYKALANAGTWMLGRLQTARDKARVLEGLEGAAASAGAALDRAALDARLSALAKRTFVLHNVHAPEPVVFQTRWTLSYLRGPMGREEIRRLVDPMRVAREAAPAQAAAATTTAPAAAARTVRAVPFESAPEPVAPAPVLPPGIAQYFAPGEGRSWTPAVLGVVRLTYGDRKLGVDETRDVVVFTPVTSAPVPVDWELATPAEFALSDLDTSPRGALAFAPLPPAAAQPKSYDRWAKDLARWAARSQAVELLRSASTGLTSRPDEPRRDFALRVQMAARERRDEAVGKMREKYRPKLEALDAKIARAEQSAAREEQQAQDSKLQAGVSVVSAILGTVFGRRTVSMTTLGRATTAARGMSRAGREASDVGRAQAALAKLREDRDALAAEAEREMQTVAERFAADAETFETVLVKPKRGGVSVQLIALLWTPS